MKVSKRTRAIAWGLGVAIVCTIGWYRAMHSQPRGEPMLMPGQDPSVVIFEEITTGAWVFLGTGIPTALLVYWRPSKHD